MIRHDEHLCQSFLCPIPPKKPREVSTSGATAPLVLTSLNSGRGLATPGSGFYMALPGQYPGFLTSFMDDVMIYTY